MEDVPPLSPTTTLVNSTASSILDCYLDIPDKKLGASEQRIFDLKELADVHLNSGNYRSSETLCETILERVLDDPAMTGLIRYAKEDLAVSCSFAGHYERAKQLFTEAMSLPMQSRSDTAGAATATSHHNIGNILCDMGHHEAALVELQTALAWRQQNLGMHDLDTFNTDICLSLARAHAGQYLEAERNLTDAINWHQPDLDDQHPLMVSAWYALGMALGLQPARLRRAEGIMRWVLDRQIATYGQEHPYASGVRHDLAYCLFRQGNFPESEYQGRLALQDRRAVLGEDHPDTRSTATNLARTLEAMAI